MITCEQLLNVEKTVAATCSELGLAAPVAVRSAEYDRVEMPLTGWKPDAAGRLRDALDRALRRSGWDAWLLDGPVPVLCAADSDRE